jgi:hypothetical protein
MKTVEATARGKHVARQLGWPSRCQGLWGATSSLLDPFAGFQRPRSSMRLVHLYELKGDVAVRRRVQGSARRLIRPS